MSSTEFIQTIKGGDFPTFQSMLEERPELANSFDKEMQVSALLLAIYYRRFEFAEHLLDQGVQPDIWEAAALGDKERVDEILQGEPESINQFSSDGFAPLGLVAYFGHPETMELLIEKGAEINQPSKNTMRVFPINSAAAHRNPEISLAMVKLLIAHGADVNAAQHGGITALHEAAAHGHAEKARVLLAAGADPQVEAEDGRTPLQMAKEGNHEAVVNLLEDM